MDIKTQMAELYDKRSKLSHEGTSKKFTFMDVVNLTRLVRDLMMVLTKHSSDFTTHNDFREWIEEQKLSGTVNFPKPESII